MNFKDKNFVVGAVHVNEEVSSFSNPELYNMLKLRALTYLQQGFIIESELDSSGLEVDEHDASATHIGVFENYDLEHKLVRVVGNMRLIYKLPEKLLPIENYFDILFFKSDLPIGSVEVSRLIVAYEKHLFSKQIMMMLFDVAVKYVLQHDIEIAFGVVEKQLVRLLKILKVPIEILGSEKYLPAFRTNNLPIKILLCLLDENIETSGFRKKLYHDPISSFNYF